MIEKNNDSKLELGERMPSRRNAGLRYNPLTEWTDRPAA
jgi:hypothetical protein